MGTGVGEAALAAEAIGTAEAAGAVAGGAGFLEGMAGVSALEGAGVAGLGLGTGAGLTTGAGLAGGLGSLSPAFQTALGETAVFNPEIAAQTAQFANVGAIPDASAALGAGQMGDPALIQAAQGAGNVAGQGLQARSIVDPATAQLVSALQNAPTSAQLAAQYGPGTDLARVSLGTVTDAGGSVVGDALARNAPYFADVGGTGASAGLPFTTGGAQVAASAVSPEAAAWDAATSGQYYGPEAAQTLAGNANKAALLSDAGYGPLASPAELGTTQATPGIGNLLKTVTQPVQDWWNDQNKITQYGLGGLGAMQAAKYLNKPQGVAPIEPYTGGPLRKFTYDPSTYTPYTYKPYAAGGPVEEMSRENALGANTGYPQADIQQGAYATPWQTPVSRNVVTGPSDANVDQMTGEERMAGGGIASLGGYSDGGRLLKGPGDGMSDNIPANISGRQPARLADGEFVVPADVVSGLGNGSTDAGAKQLYKMLDKVRSARTGTKKQGKQINPNKYTPA